MAKQKLSRATNVEIKPKLKCQKTELEQIEIMEAYTAKHQETANMPKEIREIECIKILLPKLFRTTNEEDLICGRMDYLPVGFGCVTSVGGVGHYCNFFKMNLFKESLSDPELVKRVEKLIKYWEKEDCTNNYMNKYTDGVIMTAFAADVAWDAPISSTSRLSGMMLDYNKLVDNGIDGLRQEILARKANDENNPFYIAGLESLDLFATCCDYLVESLTKQKQDCSEQRANEINTMIESLKVIRKDKPKTFHQALQLVWLYALMAGVINYGRLDDVLGEYLVNDLNSGLITREQAHAYVKCLWTMIENKRTTVNGRVIVGGRGRRNPKAADEFARICLDVAYECRYVEPQFTLRLYEDTPEDIFDKAIQCLSVGATYPTLYNDAVHVPGLAHCMNITEKEAEQYACFGCGEMNIVGKTVSPPNVVYNLLKTLNIVLNEGIDPWDGVYKAGPVKMKKLEDIKDFEELFDLYNQLNLYYIQRGVDCQVVSYKHMNETVAFMYNSLLMDDCIEKGKALLDGGIKYLGGSCETFGNINCSDSLTAIKKLVFDDKKYTLREVSNALNADFEGYEQMRKDMWKAPKYGNDDPYADEIANRIYDSVAIPTRQKGMEAGLHYYGIVIINNSTNTSWGEKTSASADGRHRGVYMNPSNNPQGGADTHGPTAMLNSLVHFDPKYQLGTVQNIKFETKFFKDNIDKIKLLIKAYFKKGGCQLMVTVVDSHALEDAMIHPEKYPNMLVRVSGFSAVFVELDRSVQTELLSRTLHSEM